MVPKGVGDALACRTVSKLVKMVAAVLAAFTVIVGLAACGGGDGASEAVARVGKTEITKPELNHWMATLLGGDFYEITGKVAPQHLVSEPVRIGVCTKNLATLAPHLTSAQLVARCRQLHSLLREQAIEYLIEADVVTEEDAELGITVDQNEVEAAFNTMRSEDLPTEAVLREYLVARHWSLSDELFLVKRDLQSSKRLKKVHEKLGKGVSEAALDAYYNEVMKKWVANTSCMPGAVVDGCKEYKPPKAPVTISPAIAIEEIAGAG